MKAPALLVVLAALMCATATSAVATPSSGAAEVPDFVSHISAGRIAVISDGDFVTGTYTTARLAPRDAGYRDILTVLSMVDGKLVTGTVPVSNSVTAAPEILQLTRDGRTAFVTERLGGRRKRGGTVQDLPPGQRLFAIDLSDAAAPRLADTAYISAFPEALSVSPDGGRVAVVSNTRGASIIQIANYSEGRFGPVASFDLAKLGLAGSVSTRRGGVTATNVHWHPGGRYLAVNINTQNRVAFFEVSDTDGILRLRPWGNSVEVGVDPFVGRFTPDGRHYLTSNWGRDFTATSLEGRIPKTPSTISVLRISDPTASGDAARHELVGGIETGHSAEGIAVSPDGRLVATVNMRGTVFLPDSARYEREASVTLLTFDPVTGAIARVADYRFEGALAEGGTFDLTGDHLLATVFQGHDGAGPEAGAGLEVFRVVKGAVPSLERLGRVPLPHGTHHVDVAQ